MNFLFSSRRRHTRCALVTGVQTCALPIFLELLEEYGQAITWTDRIMPEPDLRNIAVAASRDVNHAPAILFDNIAGYPGKRTVVGVHGSWDNIALLLGQPKGTTIRDMFFDIAGRWGDASAQISRVSAGQDPVP